MSVERISFNTVVTMYLLLNVFLKQLLESITIKWHMSIIECFYAINIKIRYIWHLVAVCKLFIFCVPKKNQNAIVICLYLVFVDSFVFE